MNGTQAQRVMSFTAAAFAAALLLTGRPVRAAQTEKVLFDFNSDKPRVNWVTVNDNVMGGVSKGGSQLPGNGTLVFTGSLSLENRGGFSSIRTERKRMNLSGYEGLAVRVRGDGRTYWLTINTNVGIPAGSYRVLVPTKAGRWMTVRAPFKAFKATSFGRELPIFLPLDPAKVESVGFLIADKKAGPFRMEVDWIKAVPKAPDASPGPTGATGETQPKDIVDTALAAGGFNTLAAALKAAGLVETLKGKGPFTVFAPTDEAFAKLPKGTVESLLKPENRKQLTAVLTYHVVPGRIALGKQSLGTVEGSPVVVTAGECLAVNGAKVTTANIAASNGVIHVIDNVLLPKSPPPTPAAAAKELIELAIARGVPLFNGGNPEACTAIYEIAAQSLLRAQPSPLTEPTRKALDSALAKIAASSDARANAWTLRRALDHVYSRL